MIALLLALTLTARADDAERQRLQTELHNLAQRGSWTGVDRTYRQLVALEVPLAAEDHFAGYQAAQNLGASLSALYRLQRVPPIAPAGPLAEDAQRALDGLRAGYGLVAFAAAPGSHPRLERPEMPFAPDQRAAIEAAQATLAERGELRALLPAGRYVIDGATLDVHAGPGWHVPTRR